MLLWLVNMDLAGGDVAVAAAIIGQRLDLVGSEDRKQTLVGSENSKFGIIGSEDRKQTLRGI